MEAESLEDARRPRPAAEWHEDDGNVLWWTLPVCEPPHCGTPLDSDWPEDFDPTHWTPLVIPVMPDEDQEASSNAR